MQRFFISILRRPGKFIQLIFVYIAFVGFSGSALSQDAQLSLYTFHPLFINPSYTGSFEGDWRFSAGYRNQQVVTAQPYQTAIASIDGHFYLFNQKIGGGLYVLNDESGIGGLTFTKIYGSLAYEADFNASTFGIGIQGGFVSGNVNGWGSWDNTAGSFTAPNGEEFFGERTSFADVNLGLSWKRKMNKLLPWVALGLFHLNTPNSSFLDGDDQQDVQILLDTRVGIDLKENLLLTPLILFSSRHGISHSVIGTDLQLNLRGKRNPVQAVFGGCHLQNGILEDATSVLIHLGTRIRRLDIGAGYEMNLGNFGETTGKTGAFEIAIVYESISTVLNSYSIPCERF